MIAWYLRHLIDKIKYLFRQILNPGIVYPQQPPQFNGTPNEQIPIPKFNPAIGPPLLPKLLLKLDKVILAEQLHKYKRILKALNNPLYSHRLAKIDIAIGRLRHEIFEFC